MNFIYRKSRLYYLQHDYIDRLLFRISWRMANTSRNM